MNLLSCSLQVHNCPRVLLALTWHADLAPQSTSWLRHFIKRHQHHHLHHLLASGLRDLHGGVHGQGTVVASSGGAHADAERVRHAHPQRDATAREPRGLERERWAIRDVAIPVHRREASCRAEPGTSVSTSATDSSDAARTRGTTAPAPAPTTMWPSRTRPASAGKKPNAAANARGRTARGSADGGGGGKKRSLRR